MQASLLWLLVFQILHPSHLLLVRSLLFHPSSLFVLLLQTSYLARMLIGPIAVFSLGFTFILFLFSSELQIEHGPTPVRKTMDAQLVPCFVASEGCVGKIIHWLYKCRIDGLRKKVVKLLMEPYTAEEQ